MYVVAFEVSDEEGVQLLAPTPELKREDETPEQFANRIADKDLPANTTHAMVLLEKDLPTRFYRRAWAFGGGVSIDIEIAKEIEKNRWRAEREPILSALDKEVSKALALDDKAAALVAEQKRQQLRDVTKTDLSAVASVADLKAVRPAALDIKPTGDGNDRTAKGPGQG